MKKTLLGLACATFIGTSIAQTFDVEKVKNNKITVDGNVTEWPTTFVGPFVKHDDGTKATQEVLASYVWDDNAIYFAFKVTDSKIVGSAQNQDSPIFNTDDLVEIFMDADGDGTNYVEIGTNAYSTNYDFILKCVSATCGGWSDDQAWDATGLQTVAKKTSTGFDVEVKIPFAALSTVPNGNFTTPTIGTTWKGNLYRIDYGLPNTEYLALSSYGSFGYHQPSKFKTFKFVDNLISGTEELNNTTEYLFPNPAVNEINIKANNVLNIQIINAEGNIIKETNMTNISTSELITGIYTAKITTSEGVLTTTFIKQ